MSFRVISAPVKVTVGKMPMFPGVRYVVPAGIARHVALALMEKDIEYTQSSFNSFWRPYGGADLNGKRLAVFRHSAFGDQLMTTAVVCYLKQKYPAAEIDVYCAPDVLEIWKNLPVRAIPAPMKFDDVRGYDWHLFFDQMLEENREPDQACAYDDMFGFAGHRDAPDWAKRPVVVPGHDHNHKLPLVSGKYLVYQLSAANPNRTYPFHQGAEFLRLFKKEFPAWKVVLVGKTGREPKRSQTGFGLIPDFDLVDRLQNFRDLIPLVYQAGLVVCPDSSIGHLAAAFPNVPVISLWGLFAPNDRAKYYHNHHPLWPRHVCPFAPCHNHDGMLPQKLCAEATNANEGEQSWCNVLRAITPEMILTQARLVVTE